jgi:hypothetical protein
MACIFELLFLEVAKMLVPHHGVANQWRVVQSIQLLHSKSKSGKNVMVTGFG